MPYDPVININNIIKQTCLILYYITSIINISVKYIWYHTHLMIDTQRGVKGTSYKALRRHDGGTRDKYTCKTSPPVQR